MSVRVTVVIPVHNTGPYLEPCLDSILGQTLREIEAVAVDDASSDGSLDVLKKRAERDARLRVIAYPSHVGVSAARNAGLDVARGEYVFFMDSDDWLDTDYLASMLVQADETGQKVVVNANFVEEYPDGRRVFSGRSGFLKPGPAYYPVDWVQSRMLSIITNRLYRKAYLDRNGIRFPLIEGGGEDTYFSTLAEVLQPRSYVFWGPFYHYRQRPESVAHARPRGSFPYIENYKALYDALRERQVPLDGLALFHTGMLVIDSREQFDFLRAFLLELEPQMRSNADLYTTHDRMLLDVILPCPDYDTFLSRHNPQITLEFIRSLCKRTL